MTKGRRRRPSIELISSFAHQWLGRELNPRHADFQSAALPTELPSRAGCCRSEQLKRIVFAGQRLYSSAYGRLPCTAVMTDFTPPRTLKSPTTRIHFGFTRADKSSRILFTARS